jgi:hypothetical protein
MFKLAEEHNLKIHSEPFYIKNRKENININWELEENFILKTIVNQVPSDGIYNIDFYKQFSNIFDEVIILSRRDLVACTESLSYLLYNKKDGFSHNESYVWNYTPNYNEIKEYINKCDVNLKQLSVELKKDIIYYEDIFNPNSDERLRINNQEKKII